MITALSAAHLAKGTHPNMRNLLASFAGHMFELGWAYQDHAGAKADDRYIAKRTLNNVRINVSNMKNQCWYGFRNGSCLGYIRYDYDNNIHIYEKNMKRW